MSLTLTDGNVNLVVNDADLAALTEAITPLLTAGGARCALLIDTAGKVITAPGDLGGLEPVTIAALAAGNYATTRALAQRVGEREFSLVFQRDRQLNLHLSAVTPEALLIVLFDEATTLGAIRTRIKQVLGPVRRALAKCVRAVVGPAALQQTFGVEAPAAAPAATEGAKSEPPMELVKRFWRVRALAEDCIRNGVERTQSDDWKRAAGLVGQVARLLLEDKFEECARGLSEAERTLMQAYGRAMNLASGADESKHADALFERLEALAASVYQDQLGAHAAAILARVDEETRVRFPGLLGLPGTAATEEALRKLTPEQRRHMAIRAHLDLLLSRAWVIFKIFGKDVCRDLLRRWDEAAASETAVIDRLNLRPGLKMLHTEVNKRLDRIPHGIKP